LGVFVDAMINDPVWHLGLTKRFATMSFLAAGLFTRFSPQAFWLRRIGKVTFVRRWRFTAGAAGNRVVLRSSSATFNSSRFTVA
jgi:hypothetical protein